MLLSAWAATRVPKGLRGFWLLVSLACASWLAGELLWSFAELSDDVVPFPWWTDAFYFGFYGAILAALISFFRPSLRLIGGQALLDGLLAVASLALLWWWLVLRDLPLGVDRASLAGLSYPVLDLVLLCTIAATPLVSARRGSLAGWLVAAGVAAGGIADGVYTHLVLTDRYVSGGLIDLGWQIQGCLICLAAVAAALAIGRKPNWAQRRSPLRIRTAVSMTGALLVILLVLVVEGARGEPSARAIVLVFVVTALLLVRGWLLLISTARESARRDPLTGVYDEPHLHDQLRRLAAAARQYDEPFALVLMHVPRRHEDEALGRLVGTARELDLVARLDDGRLAVVLARISEPGASEAAERLRAGIRTSATAGVAVWRRGDTGDRRRRPGRAAARRGDAAGREPHARPEAGRPRLRPSPPRRDRLQPVARARGRHRRPLPHRTGHSRKVARLSRDIALILELKPEAVAASYLGGLLHALGTLPLDESALRPHGSSDRARRQAGAAPRDAGRRARRAGSRARRTSPRSWPTTRSTGTDRGRAACGASRSPSRRASSPVANAIVTMTEPDGDALPLTSSLTEIWRLAGGRYDPEVVSALFRLVRDGHIAEMIEEEAANVAAAATAATA